MAREKLCKVCGTPKRFTKDHVWLPNGTTVQRRNPSHRTVFIETDNIARTFSGVEDRIGMSIENIVIEAKRWATFDSFDNILPRPGKTIIRLIGSRLIDLSLGRRGRVAGYGAIKLAATRRVRGAGRFVTVRIKEPYSLPLFCGDLAGAFGAITGRDVSVSYESKADDAFEVTGEISRFPIALGARPEPVTYPRKPGAVALESCPRCGAPMMLADYAWDLERGMIAHRERGRRMVMVGPAALDAIIERLREELGDTVNRVITEAQRSIVRTGFYGLEEIMPEDLFRRQFAIRGLGNLSEIAWRENGLRITLENSCIQPVLAGVMQGFLEMATQAPAHVSWSVTDDGDLVVDVSSNG